MFGGPLHRRRMGWYRQFSLLSALAHLARESIIVSILFVQHGVPAPGSVWGLGLLGVLSA